MTQKQNVRLLQAYRTVIAAGQDDIADAFEDVILGLMSGTGHITSPMRIGESRTMTGPPWKVTCDPDMVQLGTKVEWTGIDHLSKETTA